MKRATVLCLFLILSGTLATGGAKLAETDKDFAAFWQKFKTAVSKGDKETVLSLSRFPIRMPGRIRNIKDEADLRLRYREVFNKYANAAKCFAEQEPAKDPSTKKRAFVQCESLQKSYDVAEYDFELTKTGWRFVRLDTYDLPD